MFKVIFKTCLVPRHVTCAQVVAIALTWECLFHSPYLQGKLQIATLCPGMCPTSLLANMLTSKRFVLSGVHPAKCKCGVLISRLLLVRGYGQGWAVGEGEGGWGKGKGGKRERERWDGERERERERVILFVSATLSSICFNACI